MENKKYIHFVYVLQCLTDKTLYIGSTKDIDWRFIQHELKQSKYTNKKENWVLIYYSVFIGKDAKNKALKFEKYLKSGSGRQFIKRHILN